MSIRLLLGLALASLAMPVLLVPMPMLLDYPNHVARIWLLSGGIAEGPMSRFYELDWAALTNIGIDLLAAGPMRWLPAEVQGQVLLWLAAALPVLGAALLNRALFGGWSWWQLGFGILGWNLTLLAGFLNFNIGLGAALLAAAAEPWLHRRPGWLGLAMRFGLGFALGVMHAFALFFYAAMLCGLALGPAPHGWFTGPRLRALLWAALPPVLALAALLLLAPALPGAHDHSGQSAVQDSLRLLAKPGLKLRNGFAAIQTYRLKPDLLALLVLLLPCGWAAWRGSAAKEEGGTPTLGGVRLHAGLLAVVLAMGLIFVVCPDFANGTGWLDRRFAQMGFILLLVALRPELPVHLAPALAGLMLVMVLGRTAWVGTVWWQRAADVASVTRALAAVPPGALVLPLEHSSDAGKTPIGRTFIDGFPAYLHLPTLAIPQRQAFVPTLFTARGKQPLAVRPAFQDLSVPEGGLAPVNALDHLDRFSALRLTTPYLEHWRRFDYVLVLNADMPDLRGPVTLPRELELLRDEGFAQLYRIRHEAVAAKD